MSLLSVITKTPPKWGDGDMVLKFDAVLEDTLEAAVELSDYPIEIGSRANDHRIKVPIKWTMTGGVSNNPVKVSLTDFTGVLSELESNSGVLSLTAGIFAGMLQSDKSTRASDTLQALLKLMYSGDPFSVDTGEIVLQNMVIQSIRRTKDASNENGLMFSAQLVEWQDIATAISAASSQAAFATSGTPTASSAAQFIKKGQKAVKDATDSIANTVSGWFS